MSGTETIALHFHERSSIDGTDLPTLVFLHHFGGSGRAWDAVTKIMAQAGFRCIAPDLRGFGESPAPHDEPGCFSIGRMSDDVVAVIDRFTVGQHVLVGHSMGGKVALALAARESSALQAVVLLAPSPPTPEPMADTERARLLAGYGDRNAAEETLRKITARPLPDPLFAAAIADILRSSQPAWRAWLEHGSREDISATLDRVRVPVSIAIGAADETITVDLARREIAARLNQGAVIRSIRDAGHLLPLEAPNAAADFILAQLRPLE